MERNEGKHAETMEGDSLPPEKKNRLHASEVKNGRAHFPKILEKHFQYHSQT